MVNKDIDQYTTELYKYCYDTGFLPLITISANSAGLISIFADNSKLTHDQKIKVLQSAIDMCAQGIRKELADHKKAIKLDLNNGKIFEA